MKSLLTALLFLLAMTSGRARVITPPPPYFDSFAQDGTGKIWATSRAEYGRVYAFDGTAWKEMPFSFPDPENPMPAVLLPLPGGAVLGLWRVDDTHMTVTRHNGESSEVTGRFEAKVPGSGLQVKPFGDSKGRVWITSNAPLIHRLEQGGAKISSFTLPEDVLARPKRRSDGFNRVEAVEDGRGAIWLWSGTHSSNYTSLQGLYRFNETGWHHVPAIPGIGKMQFSCIAPKDASHLWAATREGLFEIDTAKLEATPSPEPEPGAFAEVLDVFQYNGNWHAISIPRRSNTRHAALWRLQEGGWQKLIPRFDSAASAWSRHWSRYVHGDHLLLSTPDGGPWILPKKGEPARLTWRNRFPLEGLSFIAPLRNGLLFMAGHGGLLVDALPLPAPLFDNPRVTEFPVPSSWAPDPAGHFWAVRADRADASDAPWPLLEWTGKAWLTHPLPDGQSARNYTTLLVDTKNRVWLHSNSEKRPTFILHPEEKRWENFADAQSAYLAYRSDPPEWFAHKPHRAERVASYGKGGEQLAFVQGTTLHYFNGKEWKKWPRREIAGSHGGIQQVPYFDKSGKLCAQFNDDAWRLEDDGTWRAVALEEGRSIDNHSPPVPDWFPETKGDKYVILDNTGTYWIISEKRLYRARDGNWVPVFKENENDPFRVKSVIFEAWQDAAGNAILNAAATRGSFIQIAPQSPPPKPRIHVSIRDEDHIELTLEGEEIFRWHWRLDEGPWLPTAQEKIDLVGVPNGKHRVEAKALNRELAEAVATATFTIQVDTEDQLARLIKLLNAPDYELRKQALAGLARQPRQARGALVAALTKIAKTDDDDYRWWLTAALQEVERILQKETAATRDNE